MTGKARDETPRLLAALDLLKFLLQAFRESRVRGRCRIEQLEDDLLSAQNPQ